MAWHEGKPEYRSSPNSKEVRENFAYLKALADLVVKADLVKLHGITSSATEINQLQGSGVVKADLVKLHAITSTHTEINQLHESGVVKADLEKLHAITSTHTEINQLHESGVVKADLVKLHGITLSYAQINALINNVPPVGSIIAYVPGYFTNGSNAGFTYRMVSANTVAAVNALLNPSGWYVCNGAALNDAGSGIFNGAGRYLPNLTDDRFFMGDTVAGGIGGANSNNIAHTHTTGNHTLTVSEMPAHFHYINFTQVGTTPASFTTGSLKLADVVSDGIDFPRATSSRGSGEAHNHGNTGSSGSTSLENRPKYLSCFYIMRVK
jgi:microcystin-dependent protein